MKMKQIAFLLPAAVLLLQTGCTAAYNVEVYMSPKVKELYQVRPSLELDLVGASKANEEHFKEISVRDYFSPDNKLRAGNPHATLHFSEISNAPKKITSSDPIWKKFAKTESEQLYLLVSLPPVTEKQTKSDIRKIVIPLEYCMFFNTRYFEITPNGLVQLRDRPDYAAMEIETEKTEDRP